MATKEKDPEGTAPKKSKEDDSERSPGAEGPTDRAAKEQEKLAQDAAERGPNARNKE